MRIKRIAALLLSAVFLIGLLAACSPKENPPPPEETPDVSVPSPGPLPGQPVTPAPPSPPPTEPPMTFNTNTPGDTFVVGVRTMDGDFIDGFGDNIYDRSIKVLLGHYAYYCSTYYRTADARIALNPAVVRDVATDTDAEGNKTYTFEINDDLKWSDGTPITAEDFAACILLYASPEFRAAGASSPMGGGLLGNAEYRAGSADCFRGVRVLGDFRFSLTIDAKETPYFWETFYVMAYPVPTQAWLPGIEVISGDDGACFSGDIAELCRTIAGTERYAPSVSSGPYMFDSYDGSTVTLRRNPYFKGDQSGNMPAFEWIIQTVVPDGEGMAVSMLLDGDIDFISHDTAGDYSEMAMNSPLSNFSVANRYYRDGFGAISFVCDWGATADPNVRWAIACMIDRSAIIDDLFGGYGATVDSAYSLAQWAYLQRSAELAARLSPIAADLGRANDFLDRTEWVFEADGVTPFNRAMANADGSYMRHNSSGEALVIHHLSASTRVGGAIESETSVNGPLIGMSFEVDYGDSNTLLDNYYYGFNMGDVRYYNSFNLAISITVVDDMYWSSYHSDMLGTWLNSTQYASPELDAVISQMRRLDPSEAGRYSDLWVESQALLQQGLPIFPLYSNEYFDFFNSVVKSVPTTPYNSYEEVICQIEKWQ